MLIHVGDDIDPSVMSEDGTYHIHLLPDHHDPDLSGLTYGDWVHRTHKFDALTVGDFIFFNFKFNDGSWRVTSYFRLSEIWKGARSLRKFKKQPPYRYNAHIIRGDLESTRVQDFRLFVADPEQSNGHMHSPVVINETFWASTNLRDKEDKPFQLNGKTVNRINGSFLRAPKLLNGDQTVGILKTICAKGVVSS